RLSIQRIARARTQQDGVSAKRRGVAEHAADVVGIRHLLQDDDEARGWQDGVEQDGLWTFDKRETAAMDVVARYLFEIARRSQKHVKVARQPFAEWLERAPRPVVDEERTDAEAPGLDHPLHDQPAFGDKEALRVEQLGFGHAAVGCDPGIVRPGDT